MTDSMRVPVIVGAARTPIGRFLGGLSALRAPELGAAAVRAALERSGVEPGAVEEVFLGNVLQAGLGQAPARQAALNGGVPDTASAVTVNEVCGSGLKAVMLAAQAIRAGDLQVAVAGGFESMSGAPHYLRGMRGGVKLGDRALEDGLILDGLWCSFGGCHMGGYAEATAAQAGVTREDADRFALESHRRAVAAMDVGAFAREIVPVEVPSRKGPSLVDADEGPRRDTSIEALSRLPPAFPDEAPGAGGEWVVTAGNAPGLNDGAAAVVLTSEAFARAHELEIRARIAGAASGGGAPRDLFLAPVATVRRLLERTGTELGDHGLMELNEAFAVQALADLRALDADPARVNVRGGAVALGHPIGASGARVLVTLLHAMEDLDVEMGLAALCLGGGSAVALSIRR